MPESICVFGDSTSWGAWDEEKGGWVNRLWLSLTTHDPYIKLYNLGIDGGTSGTILERFKSEALARGGDAFIFQTGGNDASISVDGVNRVSIEDFKENIETIILEAQKITNKIIFMDLKNCDESKTAPVPWDSIFYTNKNLLSYNEALREVCQKHGVLSLELPILEDADFEDGLHPNASGHQKIFVTVNTFLTEQGWI